MHNEENRYDDYLNQLYLLILFHFMQNLEEFVTQIDPNQKENEIVEQYPRQSIADIQNFSLKSIKDKKKQTQKAIELTQARIHYMKVKQENALKKIYHVKKRLSHLQRAKTKAKQHQQLKQQSVKRQNLQLLKKFEFNKLLKDHLDCNKKIVFSLMNEKIRDSVKKFKESKAQYSRQSIYLKQSHQQQNFEKANKIRKQSLIHNQKKRLYFLEKLKNFKNLKEEQLKYQIKIKQSHQNRIQQLEHKESELIQKLNLSQTFRMRCQQQYVKAKEKYHSFFEKVITTSRKGKAVERYNEFIDNEQKANIFIS